MGRVSRQAGRRAACGHTEVRDTTSEGPLWLPVPDMAWQLTSEQARPRDMPSEDSRWRARHWSLCKMAKHEGLPPQVVSGREFVFPLEVRNNSHTDNN